MSDTYTSARDVILGIFLAQWRISNPNGAMDFQDKPFEPPTGTDPWCRVTLRHSGGGQTSLTGPLEQCKRFTNNGSLFLQLMAPVGVGLDSLYALAEPLASAYRTAKHGNVWFRNVRIDDGIPSRGPWAQINLIVDFTYDTIN